MSAITKRWTVRPSWRKVVISGATKIGVFGALYVLGLFWLAGAGNPQGVDGPWELLPGLFILGVLAASLISQMSTTIELNTDHLVVRSMLRNPRIVRRVDIRGIALRTVSRYMTTRSVAIVVGRDGKGIASLPETAWQEKDLGLLRSELGSIDRGYHLVDSTYRTEFPDVTNDTVGWLIALAVIVLIFVGVYLERR
jgi:hypothetical protein